MSKHPIISPIIGSLSDVFVEKGLSVINNLVKDVTNDGVTEVKNFIEDRTGIDISNEDLVINLTPEEVDQVNTVVTSNEVKLEEIRLKYQEVMLADTMDAREMHVELAKLGPKGMLTFQNILAAILMLYWFLLTGILLLADLSEQQYEMAKDIFMFSSGTIAATIVGYYFGNKA